jgi:hypothetical protein
MPDDSSDHGLSRRVMLKIGSAALIGAWGQGELYAAPAPQTAAGSFNKPLYLAPDHADIVAVSRAENLFWCDIMMEHASFFAMLMPGPELATQRGQAETFQKNFQTQYDRINSATLDRGNYASITRSTLELIKPFIEYKRRMLDAQTSGKMRSLVFPLMFDHTAREAEHAFRRLDKLTASDATLNYGEIVEFWSSSMSDESEFIAHFLDPQEQDLIGQAFDSSAVFKGYSLGSKDHALPGGEIVLALEDFLEFETSIADGVNAGRIKSVIQPALADHMRRETLKFMDEVKRTGTRT